jgi:hypothetical protein
MGRRDSIGWLASAALAVCVTTVAAATPAQTCGAGKNKAAGKYAECRHKAEGKFALVPDLATLTVDLDRCAVKLSKTWSQLETRAAGQGGACPSTGDGVTVQERIASETAVVATALAGGPLIGGFFGMMLKTGETTCFENATSPIPCAGTGQDGELRKGLSRVYIDHGDGTITDTKTGLMWEKESDDGSIHDGDARYGWAAAFAKVATLNATSFAGYTDWRLPNVIEVQSLMDYGISGDTLSIPAVSPAFNTGCVPGCSVLTGSCTKNVFYWTSTTTAQDRRYAFGGWFSQGSLIRQFKTNPLSARAVRGGA